MPQGTHVATSPKSTSCPWMNRILRYLLGPAIIVMLGTIRLDHMLGIGLPFTSSSPFSSLTARIRAPLLNGRMNQLEILPSICRLSDHVVRVLGQNPGKFTLQGTNTYIIGIQNPYTLIDTGEGREEYIPILESALRDTAKVKNTTEPDISDIIISHWHPDHVNGLPTVLSLLSRLWERRNPSLPFTPPRLHKFPRVSNASPSSHGTQNTLPSIISSLPRNLYTPSPKGDAFHDLRDSQTITPQTLRVLHTPGHTDDSIALYIPQDRALYTGDSVLGQGTAVFEDLALYLKSLDSMLHFGDSEQGGGYEAVYPGHGPVIPKGKELIREYITHRLEREAQILKVLGSPPPSNADPLELSTTYWSTWTIVTTIYAAYPESLWLPAARGVDLHLRKLEGEGVVRRAGGEGNDTSWEMLNITTAAPVDHQT